jgi:glycosyltransferase involved in cell wall biosynthesis
VLGPSGWLEKMAEKILLLSEGVPPAPVAGAVIVGNLAQQFSPTEMVVAGEEPYGGLSTIWKEHWPRLVYLTRAWPESQRGSRWWRRCQFPLLLIRCRWLAKQHHCTVVIAVFPREEFLLAGYLTAVSLGAKFYPYLLNTYVENRQGLSLRFARWLQARAFSKAEEVLVMSEGMVELYRERYPDLRCSALVHSFNGGIPDFSPPPEPGNPVRFTVCGNISESCRDAAIRVGAAISQIEDASLTLLSGTHRSYLEKIGLLRNGVRHETVSPDDVLSHLQQADFVVLPHGFSGGYPMEEYRTIFPTRTIEYLICGRPILAHSPPDCYLTRFLREHGCALIVDEPSIEALLEAIDRLRTDHKLRSNLVRNALRTAEIFQAPRVALTVRALLNKNEERGTAKNRKPIPRCPNPSET